MKNNRIPMLDDCESKARTNGQGCQGAGRRFRANPDYLLREVAGEWVLVPVGDQPGNVMIALNQSCAFLWKLLQEPRTIDDLVNEAERSFAGSRQEMEAHIQAFIAYRLRTGHVWEVK